MTTVSSASGSVTPLLGPLLPIAEGETRGGAGRGIAAMLELMPNPLPTVTAAMPSPVALARCGLLCAADGPALVTALRGRNLVDDAKLLSDLLENQWLSSWDSDAIKTACRTALTQAREQGKSARETVLSVAQAAKTAAGADSYYRLNLDLAQLEALGLFTSADTTAARQALRGLGYEIA